MLQRGRRFGAVWFLILISFLEVFAQSPTAGDVMRERVKKAKALVAVKNYNAAIYELEGIRRETNEPTVNSVAQVMLMNCYLEQSDYKRAQALLTEMYNAKKQNRFGGENYYAVAGQVVRGAKTQLERYKSLGLMVSDATLPPESVADVNKMRETVETVITQSKTLGTNTKETANAMALLEEATNARGGLARDDFDAKHWKDEVADARDSIMNSRGVIVDAVGDAAPINTAAAVVTPANASNPPQTAPIIIPAAGKTISSETKISDSNQTSNTSASAPGKTPEKAEKIQTVKPDATAEKTVQPAQNQNTNAADSPKPSSRVRKVENTPNASADNTAASTAGNTAKDDAPIAVGSLVEYATAKISPTYPMAAKIMRTVGTVRVDLIVDENGKPEIQNASGPGMLKQAALDALKRWKFKPFTRDGQPVKATGYVSFSFNL